ncbi:MAG: hypothetical protein IM631_12945 [Cytophagales bacterium]|nr:hypothetical protein [Cytophagales bacterium]MCA6372280.1 hypothetical protein [Cytophagales bacterium]MCA6382425.1 hypothetical protein [Cytophagales bacterium]
MANICSQTLTFSGNGKRLKKVISLFEKMEEACRKTGEGQKPDFLEGNECRYMFDINVDGDSINFWSKWSPAIETVRQIAVKYKVNCSLDYEELGCLIYGNATFTDGVLVETDLDEADFDSFQENEDGCSYSFEGEEYSSQYDIMEKLLDRKKEMPLAL